MQITGYQIAYDTGFPGYSIPSSGFPKEWRIAAGLRLDAGGFAIIDQQQTATSPVNTWQIRMYRVDETPSVSGAAFLSKDSGDTTPGSALAGASPVPGSDSVVFTTSNSSQFGGLSGSLFAYTYNFSGGPSKISSTPLPGSTYGGVGGGAVPIVALSSGLSVACMNTNLAAQGLLGLAWQWAEGFIQIVGGVPQSITNVAAWHTTIDGAHNAAIGGNYYITDAARLSSSSFVVIAAQGNTGGSGAPVGQALFLMQMDLSGNIVAQTTIPNTLLGPSAGAFRIFPPRFQRDMAGGLYLSYITETGSVGGAAGQGSPYVIALDSSTGQPLSDQYSLQPVGPQYGAGSPHPGQPNGDFTRPIQASGLGGGQWFVQTPQKVCKVQQAPGNVQSGGAASFASYIDRSFWGASSSRDFNTPPDITPAGSVIGLFTCAFPGTGPPNPGYGYQACFAISSSTALCIGPDFNPGTRALAGQAHSVYLVTTTPEVRPAPPGIVATSFFPPGYTVQFVSNPPPAALPLQQGLGIGLPYLLYWAFSSTGTFVYHRGGTPPPTNPGDTAFLGILGAIYDGPPGQGGNTGLTGADQTSPYAWTTATLAQMPIPSVVTQRFDYQLQYPQVPFSAIYGECIYTWRSLQLVWTQAAVAPPPPPPPPPPPGPPTTRGKLSMGPQSVRPRVRASSTGVGTVSLTLGLSTSGVPSAGGGLQIGPQIVRPR